MRINTSMMLQQTSQTSLVQKSLSKVLQKLSTGNRINSAADDPAGLAVAKRLEAMSRGYKRAGMNIEDATSALNIAEGGSSTISDILQRQRELAVQASNDTLTDQDRQALDSEYQQLNQELARTADSTQFNTMDLLNGGSPLSDGSGQFQTGPNAGGANQIDAPSMNMTAGAIGSGGSIATAAGAQAALTSVSSALDQVSGARANIGALTNRLESAYRNNSSMEINTTEAQSRLADLDYAQETMELARNNIMNQTAISASNHFNQISKHTILGLLQ